MDRLKTTETLFTSDLCTIVRTARENAYRAVNTMQVASNWLIGWRIVEQEKDGQERAEYGKHVVQLAADTLTAEFGIGYSMTTVKNCVRFYSLFPNLAIGQALSDQLGTRSLSISQALSDQSLVSAVRSSFPQQLSWSHYERLIRVKDEAARMWYMHEAASQQWDYRTLKRNIDSQYYNRLLQTPEVKRPEVEAEMNKLTADYQQEISTFC